MSEKFDCDAALMAIQSGQSITGKDGVLAPLVKQLTEAALEGELDSHLAEDVAGADSAYMGPHVSDTIRRPGTNPGERRQNEAAMLAS